MEVSVSRCFSSRVEWIALVEENLKINEFAQRATECETTCQRLIWEPVRAKSNAGPELSIFH